MISARNNGFTLIEIMIVIAIIGILAAIAIPQFSEYRIRSYNISAMADLRNAATAQEAYHIDYKAYANSDTVLIEDYNLGISRGVSLTVSGSTSSYTIISHHSSGNKTYSLIGPGGEITSN